MNELITFYLIMFTISGFTFGFTVGVNFFTDWRKDKLMEIDKYMHVGIIGLVAIMAIPVILIMSPLALFGYIICKIFKMSPDKIRYFDYE